MIVCLSVCLFVGDSIYLTVTHSLTVTQGDDPARKALFDSLLSGCIPIIFHPSTLYNQYPLHLNESSALDLSVYIPGGLLTTKKINFMHVLNAIPQKVIYSKQMAIEKIAKKIQYAMPPMKYLNNIYDTTIWDPPFADAAELALDGFIEIVKQRILYRNRSVYSNSRSDMDIGQRNNNNNKNKNNNNNKDNNNNNYHNNKLDLKRLQHDKYEKVIIQIPQS
jgi:hypothetical protein